MVYVEAPVGCIANELPMQIKPLFTKTVGKGFTMTLLLTVFEEMHPAELVPTTE